MFGYATDETEHLMPLAHTCAGTLSLANKIWLVTSPYNWPL